MITFTKASAGRWAVMLDGVRIGTAWNNGARKTYGRSWSVSGSGQPVTKHSSRQSAGESLARQIEAAKRKEGK